MSHDDLEKRVTALEQQVQQLVRLKSRTGKKKDWRSSVGMFVGDELMKEIDAAGAEIREKESQQARRRPTVKRRRAKA